MDYLPSAVFTEGELVPIKRSSLLASERVLLSKLKYSQRREREKTSLEDHLDE
jgi:hypothetical protein